MIAWTGALFLVAGFLVLAWAFRLLPATRRVLGVVENAFAVLGDDTVDDATKEKTLQRHALQSLGLFLWIAGGGAAAVALPLALVWLTERLGWISVDGILAVALSWPFIVLTCGIGLVAWRWQARRRRRMTAPAATFENRYSATDRVLHQLAFATPGAQLRVARWEDRLFQRRLARIDVTRPVFITALPRAGTTLLLELCTTLDEFVTHTYRRMPFVLTPLLWEKLTRSFRVNAPPQPRAHGDGMLVGLDSPEAMEEALWLAFWPEHYAEDRIHPWREAATMPGFVDFFQQHMRKLIAASGPDHPDQPRRYISKNNLNIARVPWLTATFPEARILIPFRAPVQHAASLLRQHRNFLAIHARDPFARRYMAAIGHFDFGSNLRPVDFDHWLDQAMEEPTDLNFWLRYWTACYRQALATPHPRVRLFDFDTFCHAPGDSLAALAHYLDVANPFPLVAAQDRVHPPKPHAIDFANAAPDVLSEALNLHRRLRAHALVADARHGEFRDPRAG